MDITKVNDQITLLKYDNAEQMNLALCRITAYLECPVHKGTIFTLGQYRQYYTKQFGGWTYHKDWSGHNIPFTGLEPFVEGLFDPLSKDEQDIVNLVRNKPKPFYLIILHKDNIRSGVVEHELAHALYGTNETYRKKVQAIVEQYKSKLGPVRTLLAGLGYHKDTFTDESHAYVGVDFDYLIQNKVPFPQQMSTALIALFKRYTQDINIENLK